MAFTDVIARLAVSLNLDTAAFQTGARKAKAETTGLSGHMKKMAGVITAAFAGIQLGQAINEFREMTKAAISSANQISRLSQVANASGAEFQRAAYGAKSVGIEGDKLADIYKDVNDKIGDFLANGGGEMADFFENVAPKVGVTAAQFEKLSGPQALQLYVSSLEKAGLSQQQMTFYMEALANDATLLLPLLKDNGAEMGRFAKAADDLGIVLSDAEIAKAGELAAELAKLNLQIEAQQNKKLLENADAVLAYEEAIGNLKLTLITSIGDLEKANQAYNDWALEFNASLRRAINGVIDFQASIVPAIANGIAALGMKLGQLAATAVGAVNRMVSDIRAAVVGRLSAVWDDAKAKIETVRAAFFNLWDKVTRRSYVPDMVDDIAREMGRLDGVMVDPATKAARTVTQAMRDMAQETGALLDRLFPEVRQLLDYRKDLATLDAAKLDPATDAAARRRLGLETYGIRPGDPVPVSFANDNTALDVTAGLDDVLDRLDTLRTKAGATTVAVAKSFQDMAEGVLSSLDRLAGAIKGGGFLDILSGVIGLGLQLGGAGLFGSKVASRINKVPGYAGGTGFHPGGLAMVGERGPELVDLPRGSKVYPSGTGPGGGSRVEVIPSPYFDVVVDGRVMRHAPAVMQGGATIAQAQMAQRQRRRVG